MLILSNNLPDHYIIYMNFLCLPLLLFNLLGKSWPEVLHGNMFELVHER